jgi:hypothetical protein
MAERVVEGSRMGERHFSEDQREIGMKPCYFVEDFWLFVFHDVSL